jgi:para-nitrobenzyl esterase
LKMIGRAAMRYHALLGVVVCVLAGVQTSAPNIVAQPSTDSLSKPLATVSTGQLRGTFTYDGEAVFKNIPYAQPPIANLRWHEPLPAEKWNGVRDATTFGPACYQSGHLNVVSSEDCLQLNIWTPAWPMKAPVPVMVWIHGGGNVAGSGIEPLFNGETLARHGVIVVTVNYRLGIFGFLAHPELTKESPHHSSGNYGLLDQIMALRWVHENIAGFGGDPANVTIFGESAGSMDVNTLMTTSASAGLFTRAIAQSGAVGDPDSLQEAEKIGESIAAKLNIAASGALDKLRAASSDDLVKAAVQRPGFGHGMLGINVDGWLLSESPQKAFASGHEHKVPLLFGSNSQEMQGLPGSTAADLKATISQHFGPLADRALALYGLNGSTEPQPDPEFGVLRTQWTTDSAFRCSTIQELIWHTASGNRAYEYQFAVTVHGKEAEGAPHASEIPFVFGTLPVWQGMRHYTLADRQYAPVIQEYWVNFARTGDPNGAGLHKWPQFESTARSYLDFTDAGPVAKEELRREICDLFMENMKREMDTRP